MPKYTYHCELCDGTYEVRHSINEIHDVCNSCGESKHLNRIPVEITIANVSKSSTSNGRTGEVVKDTIEGIREELTEHKRSLSSREYDDVK